MTRFPVKRIARTAILAAMAMAVQYMESFLPGIVPGLPVKIGFANIFVLFALETLSVWDGLTIALLRNLLFVLVSGNVSGIFYSAAGSLLSWTLMALLLPLEQRGTISTMGLSVAGAFGFQVGQAVIGFLVLGTAILYYFPWMALLSVPAGLVTGFLCRILVKRIGQKGSTVAVSNSDKS